MRLAHADDCLGMVVNNQLLGAVGIEMATELKHMKPSVQVTLAHSRDKLLSAEPLPDMVKDCAFELAEQAGVEVLLSHRLASSTPTKSADGSLLYEVEFTNGHKMIVSEVITAISNSIPSSSYLPQDALDADGYVNVRPTMQLPDGVPNAESHFAVGDLIHWSGIKRCGGALYEGKIAASNVHQIMLEQLEGKEPDFTRLAEFPPMIGLAVGKNGISYGAEGMNSGPQVLQMFFEDDLGFRSKIISLQFAIYFSSYLGWRELTSLQLFGTIFVSVVSRRRCNGRNWDLFHTGARR